MKHYKQTFTFEFVEEARTDLFEADDITKKSKVEFVVEDGTPWDEIHNEFLSWLSGLYGYDIHTQVFSNED